MEQKMTMKQIVDEVAKQLPEQIRAMVMPVLNEELKKAVEPVQNKLLDMENSKKIQIPDQEMDKLTKWFSAVIAGDRNTANAITASNKINKVLVEGTTTAGGYLTPDIWVAEINRVTYDYGCFRRDARNIPMSSDVTYIPKAGTTGITAAWTDENTAKTESTPTFDIITLTAKKLASIVAYADELAQDSIVNLVQYLTELIAESFAQAEDQQGFYGSGSPITGINSATGVNTVVLEGDLDSVTNKKILDMIASLGSSGLNGAKFYMNNKVLVGKVWSLCDDNHRPIYWQPQDKPSGYLYGLPVVTCDSLPSTDAASSPFIWLGNLKNAIMGDKGGMAVKILTEATLTTGGNLAEKDLSAIRCVKREAITIAQPGQFVVLRTAA